MGRPTEAAAPKTLDLAKLRKLFDATSKGDWEPDNVQTREDRSAHSVMLGEKGKVLFDTFNSEAAEIAQEADDESSAVHRWDETGRRDFAWIAEMHRVFPQMATLISDLQEKVAELEELRSDK
jgi:hypothetical protein